MKQPTIGIVWRLRARANELESITALPPRAFRKQSWLRREVAHTPNCQKENNSGAQALRRLTLIRQAAFMHALADRIERGQARIMEGRGAPTDWEETLRKAEDLLL